MTWVIGLLADVVASNRKLLEDIQYHVRRLDYDRTQAGQDETTDAGTEIEKETI